MKQLLLSECAGSTDQQIREWICSEFQIDESRLNEYEILIAEHNNYDYEGDAYLLLKHRDGRLFEVHGSHCSCMGFEDQFEPELVEHQYLLSGHHEYRGNKEVADFLREYFA